MYVFACYFSEKMEYLIVILIVIQHLHLVAASVAYSQSSSVKTATSLTQSVTNSVAVSTISCTTAQLEWIDELDDKFGLKYLHPDFERVYR